MKKIVLIVGLLLSFFNNTSYSNNKLNSFNKWLVQNEFTDYYKLGFAEPTGKCKDLEKFSNLWYYNKCDKQKKIVSNYKVDTYNNRSEIPEEAKPDYETLLYYLWLYLNENWNGKEKYSEIKFSENPYEFQFDLREDKYIKKQMQKTALLSYLLYEDGKIVIDELSPLDRFGKGFNNKSTHHSQSVGKSIVSYVLGHAICKGYVGDIDSQINDWPILKDTLYNNQKIIDIINMKAGDKNFFSSKDPSNRFKNPKYNFSVTNRTMKSVMQNELKGSKKSGTKHYYNNLLPHLIFNYIAFKTGEEGFQKLLDDIFRDKVGIEYDISFAAATRGSVSGEKSITNTLLATRYDYLRIAKTMLNDWQNDTCEGKYLKSLYERKINKNRDYGDKKHAFSISSSYGGFFHLDQSGLKNRHVFIMDGHGGQTYTIDFDKGRIVATMAIHRDFNWKKIAHSVIKKGK
jgi:hypothetical protein